MWEERRAEMITGGNDCSDHTECIERNIIIYEYNGKFFNHNFCFKLSNNNNRMMVLAQILSENKLIICMSSYIQEGHVSTEIITKSEITRAKQRMSLSSFYG